MYLFMGLSFPLRGWQVRICLAMQASGLHEGALIAAVGDLTRAKDRYRAIREGFLEAEGSGADLEG